MSMSLIARGTPRAEDFDVGSQLPLARVFCSPQASKHTPPPPTACGNSSTSRILSSAPTCSCT
ncbi:hypothetical protein OH77DRAFT_1419909 [Trametes cingulata]|nr:hypothetical protein OH77DRAFT_1419909 [Trametes cingulata]